MSECVYELHFPNWTIFCVPVFKLVLDFFFLLLRCSWHIPFYKFMVYNAMIWSIVPDVLVSFLFSPLWSKTCQFPFSLITSLIPQFTSFSQQPMTPIFFYCSDPQKVSDKFILELTLPLECIIKTTQLLIDYAWFQILMWTSFKRHFWS